MTDLTDEALDALVAQSRSGIQTKSMTMYKGETVDLVETFNLQMRMATTITALRDREAAIVAAAFEAAAYAVTEADRACLGARGARAAIRALTPSDATAALEAIKRAERNKARREAAALIRPHGTGEDRIGFIVDAFHKTSDAILATIEAEDGE